MGVDADVSEDEDVDVDVDAGIDVDARPPEGDIFNTGEEDRLLATLVSEARVAGCTAMDSGGDNTIRGIRGLSLLEYE